jgi:methionine--tRNA ligase beta chain
MINFEDFQKLDLRVGKILESEKIEGSEKLLKLQVDIGESKIQLVAGIAKFYKTHELINKEIIVLKNLKPRKILGVESQGMLLAADDKGTPVILTPDKEAKPGSKIT